MSQAVADFMPLDRARPLYVPLVNALRRAGWLPLLALLTGLICLIYLVTTSTAIGVGYDIQRLEREREEWRARNEQLELELAKARSVPWIESQARTRLGMVKPEKVTYVHLAEPQPASAPAPAERAAGHLSRPRAR